MGLSATSAILRPLNSPLIAAVLTAALNVVCNVVMSDADLIDKAGGPSALAARLNLDEKGAVQRVSNWKRRGIPPRVRLEHRALFDALEQECAVPAEEVRDAA